jgi:AraC family L-rhamnose operon regulatory protein RhaS
MVKPGAPVFHKGRRHLLIDDETAQSRAIAAGKITFMAVTHGGYLGDRLPDQVLPGLSSAGSWNAVGDQDWGVPAHRNEGIEIVLLETGRATFGLEGTTHDLTAGTGTVTSPWQIHRLGGPHLGPGRLHWLIIDVGVRRPRQAWRWPAWVCLAPDDLAELTGLLQLGQRPVWQATPALLAAFRTMAAAIGTERPAGWSSRLAISVNEVLLELLGICRAAVPACPAERGTRERVEELLRCLASDPHVVIGDWPVQRLASACGIGVTAFTAHCRSLTNQSPLQYLIDLSLTRAAHRLRHEPGTQITTIALDAGFGSSQYFARLFRRRFACSAGAYRRSALAR